MVAFFILLLLVVQIGFLVASRSMVAASVDASARRMATQGAAVGAEIQRLVAEIEATVPGVQILGIEPDLRADAVGLSVSYRWRPPGPDLVPVDLIVRRERTMLVPP